jgi:hypothetical protein
VTVYITQELRGRDLSNALSFGEMAILVPADVQTTDLTVDEISNLISERLNRFCDDDYLVLAGDPVCIGIACAHAADINKGRFKVLKWDRLDGRYHEMQVSLWEYEAYGDGEYL